MATEYERCGVYFRDSPGVCDLPFGHEGEHHFVSTILRNDTSLAGRSADDARSVLLYRIRRSCAIPQDVDDLIAAVRAETANNRRTDCEENTPNPRCRYRGKGDPPQDCDYPECGCVDAER